MKCKFEHDGDCCNSRSPQYMCKCKPKICGSAVPMTNADRIRGMSDEELAEFLILSPEMEFDVCKFCEYGNTSGDDRGICLTKDGICRAEANCEAFKKWLRQPTKEDT